MGEAAKVLTEPQIIKISSKRQITIPAKIYQEAGYKEYALCTWTDQGILLQPLDVEDEDVTVDILRYLVAEGYDGEELIAQYQDIRKKIVSVKDKLDEAERDIAEGRVCSAQDMTDRMRKKYGLYRQ